ncbi:MAG: pyridoxal phosphate-dependent aminotransferase [Wenzhouxiangella sp.]
MSIRYASRVAQVKPSATIAMAAKAAELKAAGKDVISLSMGEPDFDTPAHIRKAAAEAIEAGQTRYTPVDGTPELKQAVISKFQRDNDLQFEPDQILASTGAKQSLFNLTQALIGEDDEVLIPAPYWVSYPDMVRLAGGAPVILNTEAKNDFLVTASQLEASINDQTRLLVLNSPSNPSGRAYRRKHLAEIGEVLMEHPRIVVCTDDIYEHIWWADEPFSTLAQVVPGLRDRAVVVNGVSKAYAMTGWRIGYAGGPAELIAEMRKIQSQSTSNPCSISQAAAVAALNGDQACVGEMCEAFKARHDWLVPALDALPGVSCTPADGAFYVFADFSEAIGNLALKDDIELAEYLLEKALVATVPGSAFGTAGHLRLSFACDRETLESAVERIGNVL